MAQATTFKPNDQYIKTDLHDETIPAPTDHATVARRLPRFRFRGLSFIRKSADNLGSAETNNSAQTSATATTPEQESVEDKSAPNTDHPPTDPESLKSSEAVNEAVAEKKPGFLRRFRTMLTPKSSRHEKANVEEAHSQPNVTSADRDGATSATDVANAESASTLTASDHNATRPQTAAVDDSEAASGADKTSDEPSPTDKKHQEETAAPQKSSGSRSQSPAGKLKSRPQSAASKPQSRTQSPESKRQSRAQSPVAEAEKKETIKESDAAGAHSETAKESDAEDKTHGTRTKGLASRKSSAKGPRKDDVKSPTPETEDSGRAGIPASAIEDTPSGADDAAKLHTPQLTSPAPNDDVHTDSSKDAELPEPPKDFLETAFAAAASFKDKVVVKEPESGAETSETEPKEPIAAAE